MSVNDYPSYRITHNTPMPAYSGYRGDSYMDSGYFFCPFVPLITTPPILDQRDWTPNPNLERYSQANLDAGQQFYGILTFANFVEEPREKVNWMKEGF